MHIRNGRGDGPRQGRLRLRVVRYIEMQHKWASRSIPLFPGPQATRMRFPFCRGWSLKTTVELVELIDRNQSVSSRISHQLGKPIVQQAPSTGQWKMLPLTSALDRALPRFWQRASATDFRTAIIKEENPLTRRAIFY